MVFGMAGRLYKRRYIPVSGSLRKANRGGCLPLNRNGELLEGRMVQRRNKRCSLFIFGGLMKIGDLVQYASKTTNPRYEVGLVVWVRERTCLIRWACGLERNHGKQWLIKLETSETK